VIPLSLVLVVASTVALGLGISASSDPLVWVSLAAGLGAVALIAGSVVRRRRAVGPDAATADVAGPESAGAVAVGTAPPNSGAYAAGPDAEVPGPSTAPAPAAPDRSPGPPSGARDTGPGARSWPWSTAAPTGPAGWTGAVPDVRPAPPAAPPAAPPVPAPAPPVAAEPEPAVEEGMETVPVRDALRVAQLADEVLVLDGQPRYHLTGCTLLQGAEGLPLAVSAARRAGFTPCAVCTPDRLLLGRIRDRAAERSNDER